MSYLPVRKESVWDSTEKIVDFVASCLVMEIFDLYFCLHMDSGDAAQSTAIDCSWERMELCS